jgi:ABC-type amino acid transport substrate-binding protein
LRKFGAALLGCIILVGAAAGCSQKDSTKEVSGQQTIVVATSPDGPPFGYKEN